MGIYPPQDPFWEARIGYNTHLRTLWEARMVYIPPSGLSGHTRVYYTLSLLGITGYVTPLSLPGWRGMCTTVSFSPPVGVRDVHNSVPLLSVGVRDVHNSVLLLSVGVRDVHNSVLLPPVGVGDVHNSVLPLPVGRERCAQQCPSSFRG